MDSGVVYTVEIPWSWRSGPPVEVRPTTYTIAMKNGRTIPMPGATDLEVVTAADFYASPDLGHTMIVSDRYEARQTPIGSTHQAQIVDHRLGTVVSDHISLTHAQTVCLERNRLDGWLLPLRLTVV